MKAAFSIIGSVLLTTTAVLESAPASQQAEKREAQEPVDQGAEAILFGKKITARTWDVLRGKIIRALLKRYAEENEIRSTDEEISEFISANERMQKKSVEEWTRKKEAIEKELKSPEFDNAARPQKEKQLATYTRSIETTALTGAKSDEVRIANRQLAEHFVLAWKINRSLFQKYGGRVIFQQAGPEPLDAYRDFLKESEKEGLFKFPTADVSETFWKYFLDEQKHRFLNEAAGREAMTTPWWTKAIGNSI